MTTGRLRHPLNKQAVKAADDAFYARHPGKVIKGKRQSISVTDSPSHAQAWRAQYISIVEAMGGSAYEQSVSDKVCQECNSEIENDDYLHVFVLVSGTTKPVNDMFSFLLDDDAVSADFGYWSADFINSVEQWKSGVNKKLKDDPHYHSSDFYKFIWGGENNHLVRAEAGEALAKKLSNQYKAWFGKQVFFHIIGHSHGGNVINNFTSALANTPNLFGDRWFLKTIIYLSTPFFQQIEQPVGNRLDSNALIANINNKYDLTQRLIADFSVRQSTAQVSDLKPYITKIKDNFNTLYTGLILFINALIDYINEYRNFLKSKPESLFSDVKKAAAETALNDKKAIVNDTSAVLVKNINSFCNSVNDFTLSLENLVDSVDNPASEVTLLKKEMKQYLSHIGKEIEQVKKSAAGLVYAVNRGELTTILNIVFTTLSQFFSLLVILCENDIIFRVFSFTSLNMLEFYDDTVQTNKHYEAFGATTNFNDDNYITEQDKFSHQAGARRYSSFVNPIKVNEADLVQQLPTSIDDFEFDKFIGFEDSHQSIKGILHPLISQLVGDDFKTISKKLKKIVGSCEVIKKYNDNLLKYTRNYVGSRNLSDFVSNINNALSIITRFTDSFVDQDKKLYSTLSGKNRIESAIDVDNPGSVAYLAVTSHSVSRQLLYDDLLARLIEHA